MRRGSGKSKGVSLAAVTSGLYVASRAATRCSIFAGASGTGGRIPPHRRGDAAYAGRRADGTESGPKSAPPPICGGLLVQQIENHIERRLITVPVLGNAHNTTHLNPRVINSISMSPSKTVAAQTIVSGDRRQAQTVLG